jgi:hypothetical protein
MTIELLREHQDTGRSVVPYHTGKIAIGSRYTPPRDAGYASCGERHASKSYSVAWWCAMCAVAALAAVVIAATQKGGAV